MIAKVAQKLNWNEKPIYVGLDVHKESWSISIYLENRQFYKTFQQGSNASQLKKYLDENFPGGKYFCAYEAGFCGFSVQRQLSQLGVNCIVVNASDIPQTDKQKRNKRDNVDSKRIGQALSSNQLEAIYIPSQQIEADRRLVRCRKATLKEVTKIRQRIKSELHLTGIEIPANFKNSWSKKFIEWLKELKLTYQSQRDMLNTLISLLEKIKIELLEVNKKVRKLIQEDRYKQKAEILMSTPGVGCITAITFLTEIVDMNRFESFDQLVHYIGLCPTEHSSGSNEQKGNITIRGHRELRSMLIEASWVAIRNDPAMVKFYSEYTSKRTGKRSIIKIARKLLNRIYTNWKLDRMYTKGIN